MSVSGQGDGCAGKFAETRPERPLGFQNSKCSYFVGWETLIALALSTMRSSLRFLDGRSHSAGPSVSSCDHEELGRLAYTPMAPPPLLLHGVLGDLRPPQARLYLCYTPLLGFIPQPGQYSSEFLNWLPPLPLGTLHN